MCGMYEPAREREKEGEESDRKKCVNVCVHFTKASIQAHRAWNANAIISFIFVCFVLTYFRAEHNF